MRMQRAFILIFFLKAYSLAAQTNTIHNLGFEPLFNTTKLQLDSLYQLSNGDSVKIESLKFYISGIEIYQDDKLVWKEENSFHLMNAENEKSLSLSLNIPSGSQFNKIKFKAGIDSVTNCAGAMGGDLDPTLGMYWTWQNGYINFKLEGTDSRCTSRNHEFQLHLGGYLSPYNSVYTVILPVYNREKTNVSFDLAKLVTDIDLSKHHHIMSPGKEAVSLSEKVALLFKVKEN